MSAKVRIQLPALHKGQKDVKKRAKRWNVVCCGRRWGKNVLQHELCSEMVLQGVPVGWGCPTYKNMSEDWRTLVKILEPVTVTTNREERRIEVIGGGVLEMWTLVNPESIRGRRYKRFMMNEAASVPNMMDTWNQIIRPTLIDLTGDAWFFGTPKGRNAFYQLYTIGVDDDQNLWKSFHYTSYDNPFLDPSELDELKMTMTERDYRQEIMAEFLEGEGQVLRNVDNCMNALPSVPEEHKGHYIVAGVDWGKHLDYTVISVGCANCRKELEIDRFNQIDYALQRMRLIRLMQKWNVRDCLAESNAMGTPIIEQLQREGVLVRGFTTSNTSKMVLIESLGLDMEKASIQFINDPVARNEIEALERTVTETGLSKYAAPQGMHDDTVIARALMVKLMDDSVSIAASAMREADIKRLHKRNIFKRLKRLL